MIGKSILMALGVIALAIFGFSIVAAMLEMISEGRDETMTSFGAFLGVMIVIGCIGGILWILGI